MAYTKETTHYGIPLPLGSDLTTPMDYNTAMQAVDTNLFEAKTDSGSALQKANQLQQDLSTTNGNVTSVTGRVTTLEGTVTTQGGAILQNTQDIADVRADALDMIEAVDEGTAQVATIAVTAGNYFRYNDVLYLATANIGVGDTIVPNTNCKATNVGTELTELKSDLDGIESEIAVDTYTGFTVNTSVATLGSERLRRVGNRVFGELKLIMVNSDVGGIVGTFAHKPYGDTPVVACNKTSRARIVSEHYINASDGTFMIQSSTGFEASDTILVFVDFYIYQ